MFIRSLLPTVCALLALCFASQIACAQESGSAQTVPRGVFQVEGGIGFARAGSERETTLGSAKVRLGLDPKTEVRIGVPSYIFLRGGERASGFGDASIGIKRTLFGDQKAQLAPVAGNDGDSQAQEQRELNGRARTRRAAAGGAQQNDLAGPALGLVLGTSLPTGNDALSANRFEPRALLAFEATLSERVSLASNLGYTSVVGQTRRFGQIFGSLAVGYSVNEKVGYFAEVFGTRKTGSQSSTSTFLNLGTVYIVNDKFELDAAFAPSLTSDPTRNYQFGLGFTKRF